MAKQTRTIQGSQHIRALLDSKSINIDERTIDVVFVTEREVLMYNWNVGRIKEVLVCDGTAGDLSRLNNGAAVCDTHNYDSVKNGLGVVVRAWFENGKGYATLKFSKREDVEPVWQDIVDGIIRNISVGYTVQQYDVTEREGELPLYRAVKWLANEISMALVQVDQDCGVGRSQDNGSYEVSIIQNKNSNTMDEEEVIQNEGQDPTPAPAPAGGTSGARSVPNQPVVPPVVTSSAEDMARAVTAERARIENIQKAARVAGISDEKFVNDLIGNGTSIDNARALIIDKAAENTPIVGGAQSGIGVSVDESDKRRRSMTASLLVRSGLVPVDKLTKDEVESAAQFRGRSLMDMGRLSLINGGMSEREVYAMDKTEMVGRAFTQSGSDFPVILEGTIRRTLLAQYGIQADTWRQFCSMGTVSDFREYKRLRLGSFGNLDVVLENGEYKQKAIPDGEFETASIATKGNTVPISRVMIINDDLGAFLKIASMLGRAAARSIETDVYKLLLANPKMSDGKTLFHADHANIATAGTVSVAGFDAIRQLMQAQMDPSGNDYIDILPSVLLVSPAQKGQSDIINESQYDVDVSNKFQVPNKSRGIFDKIVSSPRITDNTQFAFADPNIEPVIEVDFLDGNQTPYLESKEGWSKDGTEWKIRLDYGVNAIGFRGAVKRAGA